MAVPSPPFAMKRWDSGSGFPISDGDQRAEARTSRKRQRWKHPSPIEEDRAARLLATREGIRAANSSKQVAVPEEFRRVPRQVMIAVISRPSFARPPKSCLLIVDSKTLFW